MVIMIIIHAIFYFIFKYPAHTAYNKKKLFLETKQVRECILKSLLRIIAPTIYWTFTKWTHIESVVFTTNYKLVLVFKYPTKSSS